PSCDIQSSLRDARRLSRDARSPFRHAWSLSRGAQSVPGYPEPFSGCPELVPACPESLPWCSEPFSGCPEPFSDARRLFHGAQPIPKCPEPFSPSPSSGVRPVPGHAAAGPVGFAAGCAALVPCQGGQKQEPLTPEIFTAPQTPRCKQQHRARLGLNTHILRALGERRYRRAGSDRTDPTPSLPLPPCSPSSLPASLRRSPPPSVLAEPVWPCPSAGPVAPGALPCRCGRAGAAARSAGRPSGGSWRRAAGSSGRAPAAPSPAPRSAAPCRRGGASPASPRPGTAAVRRVPGRCRGPADCRCVRQRGGGAAGRGGGGGAAAAAAGAAGAAAGRGGGGAGGGAAGAAAGWDAEPGAAGRPRRVREEVC
ncbi:hypothetical protein Nmel_015411, partial [Mimus melanotis]